MFMEGVFDKASFQPWADTNTTDLLATFVYCLSSKEMLNHLFNSVHSTNLMKATFFLPF